MTLKKEHRWDDQSPDNMRWLIEHSLYYLCQLLFPDVVEKPHKEICEFLEDFGATSKSRSSHLAPNYKLLIGSRKILKTTIKQAFMCQLGLRNPNIRMLNLLSTLENAKADLGMIKQLFDNPILLSLYPDIIPNEKERKKQKWSEEQVCLKRSENYPEPTYTAAGVGKTLTSRHYNGIFIDDAVVASIDNMTTEEIRPSPMDVAKMIGYDQVQLNGLLDEKPFLLGDKNKYYPSFIRSLNNRWGTDDYVDYLLRMRPEYDIMTVPIVWPNDHEDPTKACRPTWPTGPYGSSEALERLEKSMSTFIWSTQYLCCPNDPKENVFQKEWLQEFSIVPPKSEFVKTVAAMDLGLSLDKSACFTAVIVVAQHKDGRWYILDAIRDHLDTQGQLDMFFDVSKTYRPSDFAMENVLFQDKMLDLVRRDIRFPKLAHYGTNFYGIKPRKGESKEQRIESLQPYFRNGNIFIRKGLKELMHELIRYRRNTSAAIDLVDALSYVQEMIFPIEDGEVSGSRRFGEESGFEDGFTLDDIEEALNQAEEENLGIFDYVLN